MKALLEMNQDLTLNIAHPKHINQVLLLVQVQVVLLA
jgi:hypothetical protein